MGVNRGGLLASTGATALAFARFASFGRVPEGEGAGGGGDSSAGGGEDEDFFGAPAAQGAADPAAQGGADPAAQGGADPAAQGAGDPAAQGGLAEWIKSFSAEKKDGELSNQEWLAKIGAKDLDDVAGRYRQLEKAHRESGRVKVPGEGASETEIKAFREAIGAPEAADGYKVELPQGAEGYEIDGGFLDPMKEIANKYHIPAAAFKELGDAFFAAQLESIRSEAAGNNAARDATVKEWGADAEQGKEEFRRGLDILGLKTADVRKIQAGFGVKGTLELFRKIGQMGGEDFFAGNNNRSTERFGVANADQAKAAIDAMLADRPTVEKIRAKDPVTVQRYNRLNDALAHFKQRASQAR